MSSHHLSGLTAWLVQRLSAVFMLLYLLAMGVSLSCGPAMDYEAWVAFINQPLVTIPSAMFLLAFLLHAWVGIRDVILDYAGQLPMLRLLLLSLLGGWLIALGLWAAFITIRVLQL
jgi:succinate dehydrogenase / fumarate reductase membrane anchor subunit